MAEPSACAELRDGARHDLLDGIALGDKEFGKVHAVLSGDPAINATFSLDTIAP